MGYSVDVQLGLPLTPAGGASSATPGRLPPSPAPPAGGPAVHPAAGAQLGPCYFVRHRRARRYLLRVDADGRLRITIPRGGSQREAGVFAVTHLDWVARQRSRLSSMPAPAVPVEDMRRRARKELTPRLLELAAQHGLAVAEVSIRGQRTRWGSCSRTGRISLNWRLLLMPDWVRDYVLLHELMHLRRFDHSPAYWAHVEAACPRFREARAWLRVHGASLR